MKPVDLASTDEVAASAIAETCALIRWAAQRRGAESAEITSATLTGLIDCAAVAIDEYIAKNGTPEEVAAIVNSSCDRLRRIVEQARQQRENDHRDAPSDGPGGSPSPGGAALS